MWFVIWEKKWVIGFYNIVCVLFYLNKRFLYLIDNLDIFFIEEKINVVCYIIKWEIFVCVSILEFN